MFKIPEIVTVRVCSACGEVFKVVWGGKGEDHSELIPFFEHQNADKWYQKFKYC